MRRKIGLILCVLLILLGALALFFKTSEAMNLSGNNLGVAIPQYQHQLVREQELLQDLQSNVQSQAERLRSYCREVENKIDYLQFKIDTYSNADVLDITLIGQQVYDLKEEFDATRSLLAILNSELLSMASRAANLTTVLETFGNRQLSPERESIRLDCLAQLNRFKLEIADSRKLLTEFEALTKPISLRLDALFETSEKNRLRAINEVFSTPQEGFFSTLPYTIMTMKFWLLSLPELVPTLVPTSYEFWSYFVLLALLVNLPMLLLGRRYVYPWLLQQTPFPDKYRKLRAFAVGWFLLGASLSFALARNLLGNATGAPFQQVSVLLGSLALLIFAMAFRIDREAMRRCYRLYFPVFLGNTFAILLYILLIPYRPLVLVLPPLCLAVMLWTAIKLCRNSFPLLDTVIGWLTIVVNGIAGYLAVIGLPYIGFTMILLWFTIIAQFLTGIAATEMVIRVRHAHLERKFLNNALSHLGLPLLWLSLFYNIISMVTTTYHLQDWVQNYLERDLPLPPDVCRFSFQELVIAVIAVFVVRFLISFCKQLVRNIYKEAADFGVVPSFVTLGTYLAWAFYVLFVMLLIRINYSSILVVLGGLSMGIGFAMKEVLENFISGIILLVGQQVRPGDVIEFDGIFGKIKTVSFRATVVETWDGSVITLPNTRVLSKDFRNWTRNNTLMRRDIVIGVSYDSDLKQVRDILLEAAGEIKMIQPYPAPEVLCSEFAASSVNFTVRVWLPALLCTEVCSQYREKVFALFRERGVSIPFDQLDVNLNLPGGQNQSILTGN